MLPAGLTMSFLTQGFSMLLLIALPRSVTRAARAIRVFYAHSLLIALTYIRSPSQLQYSCYNDVQWYHGPCDSEWMLPLPRLPYETE
jgi:hypothetical protein